MADEWIASSIGTGYGNLIESFILAHDNGYENGIPLSGMGGFDTNI
jgi:hypothetical protein